jgi:TonB-linked SusC/RagA family outer membrane protein
MKNFTHARALVCLLTVLLLTGKLYAQQKKDALKGIVQNEKKESLVGVSVTIQNKAAGFNKTVQTDEKGIFVLGTLAVGGPYSFTFTYAGYEKKVLTGYQYNEGEEISLAVQLAPLPKQLDEVVVVGYGTQKKVTVTGAVTTLTSRELQQSPASNLTNALAGRLPGLTANQFAGGEPGNDKSQILIRGSGTYGGSTAPIVIVDGIERDFSNLDANEVESFTILKDASATAVYGIRGANGVIIVTTKRGRTSEKAVVSFKSSAARSSLIRVPEYLGSADYAMLYNEARINDNPGANPASLGLFSDQQIENFRKAKGDNSDGLGYNIDLLDYAFKPNWMQNYNLTVAGGTNKARYFVLAGYMNQQGNLNHTEKDKYNSSSAYKRYNFRSNIDINVTDNWYVRLDLGAQIGDRNTPGVFSRDNSLPTVKNIIMLANTQAPYYPIVLQNNNNPANAAKIANFPNGMLFGDALYRWNILGELSRAGFSQEKSTAMQGAFIMGLKLDAITKGLKVEGTFSYDFNNLSYIDRSTAIDKDGYKQYATYGYFAPNVGSNVYMNGGKYEGVYSGRRDVDNTLNNALNNGNNTSRIFTMIKLDYARSFGLHNVTGLVLGTRELRTIGSQVAFANQGLSARATYNYDERYLAEVNLGYNGSENFAKGKRYGFFPAFSAGWIVSNEKFMKNVSWLDLLKLRGSFGLVGNDQIAGSRFLYLQNFVPGGSNDYYFGSDYANLYNSSNRISEDKLANPDITWEKAQKTNIGIDIAILKKRLNISFDIFFEHRYDILTDLSTNDKIGFPQVFGKAAPLINTGIVNNRGFDFEISWSDGIGKHFNYRIRPNFSFARNKIKYMREVARVYPWTYRTGQRLGQQFGYVFDGFVQDQAEADDITNNARQFGKVIPGDIKYKDLNGDGKITLLEDQMALGHPRTPEIQFGIPIDLSYKNFDLSFLFQGAANSSIFLSTSAVWDFPAITNIQSEGDRTGKVKPMHLQRWKPGLSAKENANAKYPALHYGPYENNKLTGNNFNSSFFMYDGQYLRLKNVEIGYNLPQALIRKWKLQKVRFYVQGSNLITWDKLKDVDIDPEVGDGNGYWYPINKVINFGFEISL